MTMKARSSLQRYDQSCEARSNAGSPQEASYRYFKVTQLLVIINSVYNIRTEEAVTTIVNPLIFLHTTELCYQYLQMSAWKGLHVIWYKYIWGKDIAVRRVRVWFCPSISPALIHMSSLIFWSVQIACKDIVRRAR